MHSIIHFIYNYISKSNIHPNVYSNGNEYFSDIFFDKFKNLLDDYIVNYQIKYFFYFLFISFFYLELSEGMFQLLHNYNSYHLSIFGSFIIDLCSFLSSIHFIDFIYNFFAFNLNAVGYFFSLLSNNNPIYCMLLMLVVVYIFNKVHYLLESTISSKIFLCVYGIYSFIFFLFYYFNFIPLTFYIFFTLLLVLLYTFYTVNFTVDKLDLLIISIICSMILLPIPILFLLLFVSTYFFVDLHKQVNYMIPFSANDINLTSFVNILLVFAVNLSIISLEYASMNVTLLVLTILPFFLYISYMYRTDKVDIK